MADPAVLGELNRDVWQVFRRSYAAQDAAAFMELYTPDLIRAGGPDSQVLGYDEYAAQTGQWFAELAERGDSVDIEFRFTERLAADGRASERGVYRITATRSSGGQRVFHGRFHTFARKTDGRWRIAVDYDSNDGGTVTDAAFAAAAALDDVDSLTPADP